MSKTMLREEVKQFVSRHVNLSKYFLCTVYSWEESSEKLGHVKVIKSPPYNIRRKVVHSLLFLTAIYSLIMVVQAIVVQQRGVLSTTKILLGFGYPIFFIAGSIYRINFIRYEAQGGQLLNTLLNFEMLYPMVQGKWSRFSLLLTKGIILQGILSSILLPLLILVMILMRPCTVPYLGSILFMDQFGLCQASSFPFWVRLGIAGWDFVAWLTLATSCAFYVFCLFFLGLKCLGQYLENLTSSLHRVNLSTTIATYRGLQLLGSRFNECFAAIFLPVLNLTASLVFIMCLYVSIKLQGDVEMPGFVFFPLAGLDMLVITVAMNKIAANVYINSAALVGFMQVKLGAGLGVVNGGNKRGMSLRLSVRMVRSLQPIRVRMGHANFVDRSTPMIVLNFCISQTVSLCLLT